MDKSLREVKFWNADASGAGRENVRLHFLGSPSSSILKNYTVTKTFPFLYIFIFCFV